MNLLFIVSLLLGSCGLCLSQSAPRAVTPLGTIEGSYETTYGGRQYESYKGVAYAQPPIGDLRFAVAKPIVDTWTGVRSAKNFSSVCMQYSGTAVAGSEDCLYLNIYSPIAANGSVATNGTRKNLSPVIFFLPAGAYVVGSANPYNPKYLLDRNVTLVTINHRVGTLGFLNTEDAVVPGNAGLKDQVIALRWVKENIQYFGGDPTKISLFGDSSGGSSVHYLYLTNLTAGLFQRGISFSGTALSPWAQTRNPLEKAKRLAVIVGCPTNSSKDMVACLRSKPANQVVSGIAEFKKPKYGIAFGWTPSVERVSSDFTFLDRPPARIIASGDVQNLPWITGVVSQEGLFPAGFYKADADAYKQLNDNWEAISPYLLYFNDTVTPRNIPIVANLIKQWYFGDKAINNETFAQTVDAISDRWYIHTFEKAARRQARLNKGPVYAYYFSYRGAHSVSELIVGNNENLGVSHLDDLTYVLNTYFDPTTTPDDKNMQTLLLDFWESFATNGTVHLGTTTWPRLPINIGSSDFPYMHIAGPNKISMDSNVDLGEKLLWDIVSIIENGTLRVI